MVLASESEVMMLQDRFEPIRIVNEKHHIVDGMFLPEFAKEDLGQYTRAYGKPTDIEEIARVKINGSVQPVLLVVDANHVRVQRNVVRSFTTVWLELSLLDPTADSLLRMLEPKSCQK